MYFWQKRWFKWTATSIGLVALVVFSFFALIEYQVAQNKRELKAVMDSIEVPEEWRLTDKEFGGDITCLDNCQYYVRTYSAPINYTTAKNVLAEIVKSADIDMGEVTAKCIDGDAFNKPYCSASAESKHYRIGVSFSLQAKEALDKKTMQSIGISVTMKATSN